MTFRHRQRGFFHPAGEADPGPLTGDRLDRQAEDLAALAEAYLKLGSGQRQALDDKQRAAFDDLVSGGHRLSRHAICRTGLSDVA